ncbi:hypothetical protein ACFWNG_06400 [Streptomyces sp. NPDC058391]|uniref:hypothetical protein n=1 Tax=Streptomyces sp. NPDC058391 TaxID=3346476 RepID=UPI0036650E4F
MARRAHESDVTIDLIREEVEDLLHARYGEELGDPAIVAALLPSRSTFYLRMKESGLAEVLDRPTRARAALASTPPLPHGGREAVLRPGQVTQVDTTPLRILARGDDGRPTATELTWLIDVSNHSMCALMITPSRPRDAESGQAGQATRAIDLTLMLAQAFAPWPVMPGWDPLSAAAASTLPFGALRAADERFNEATAARPVIRPELIIYDQGSPYVSEHFTEVCDRLRIARRPARKRTGPDKSLVEHSFTTLAHRLSQSVRHGWQGRSHKKRGRGIERMPLYTIVELQQMAQEWVALEYQQTPDAGLRDPFRPGRRTVAQRHVRRPGGPQRLPGRAALPRPEPLLPAAAVGRPRQERLHDQLSDLSARRTGRCPLPGDPPARRLQAARRRGQVGMPLQPLPSRAGVALRPHVGHLGDLRLPAAAPAARPVDRGHVAGARRATPRGRRQ